MRKFSMSLIFPLILLFSVWGCAGTFSGYGAIHPDQKVTRAFETFQINPAFDYYYSGSDVYPNALIGIDKKYKLEPDLWKRMASTQKEFKDMISQMQGRASQIGQSQYGFTILDGQERQIGIWYSILEAPTTIKMIDERTVLIYTPDLDTYIKHEQESDGN